MPLLSRARGPPRPVTARARLQAAFVIEDVTAICRESIERVLQPRQYDKDAAAQWSSDCLDACVEKLAALKKPIKWVVRP